MYVFLLVRKKFYKFIRQWKIIPNLKQNVLCISNWNHKKATMYIDLPQSTTIHTSSLINVGAAGANIVKRPTRLRKLIVVFQERAFHLREKGLGGYRTMLHTLFARAINQCSQLLWYWLEILFDRFIYFCRIFLRFARYFSHLFNDNTKTRNQKFQNPWNSSYTNIVGEYRYY